MDTKKIDLVSIVSPLYRAEKSVERLCQEIFKAFSDLEYGVEIVLVDDGSPDGSWDKVLELSKVDARIKGIKLSRNYGQHYAITAGIDNAKGDMIGVVDCDLEDHPRYFRDLVAKMNEGYDLVFARRRNKKHTVFKRLSSRLFVFSFNILTGLNHDSSIGTFSLMNRKVANAFREYRESLRTYTLLVKQLGFKQGYADIEHGLREEGQSTYTLRKLLSLTLHTTLVYTEKPLQAVSVLGLFMSLFAFLYTIYVIFAHFYFGNIQSGWSSLIASIYLTGGLITFSIGINGIYLGKCFRESLKRPLYHIAEKT